MDKLPVPTQHEDAGVSEPIPEWEPLSEAVLADQRRAYDRQRATCPVARSPRGVTLFRHADVVAAAADAETFSSAVSAHRQVPNSLDPPEHAAFRAAIDPFFAPERMRSLEPRLQAIARDLVVALPRAATVDAVADIGYPFAVRAQAEWLGWQGIEPALLAWMADHHAATRSADRARTAATAAAFDALVARGARPGAYGVVGHSMGGTLALAAAIADPRIVACGTNGGSVALAEGLAGNARVAARVGAMVGGDAADALRTIAALGLEARIREARADVLVLQGGRDPLVPDAHAQRLLDACRPGQATLEYWPEGVHCLYDRATERNAVLADWFARTLAAGAD